MSSLHLNKTALLDLSMAQFGPDTGASGAAKTATKSKYTASELGDLLASGDVATFNKMRPKGAVDLSGIQFPDGLDISGANLSKAILSGAKCRGIILRGCNLEGLQAVGADLSGAVFGTAKDKSEVKAVVNSANFELAILDNVQASGVDFHKSKFDGARVTNSNFEYAVCTETTWIAANMDGIYAKGADFTDANMNRSSIKKGRTVPNLSEAICVRAQFLSAVIQGLSAQNANFEEGKFKGTVGVSIDFSGSNFTNASAVLAHFSEVEFAGAYAKGFKNTGFASQKKLLETAILDEDVPEGKYKTSAKREYNSELIDGIPGTNRELYESANEKLQAMVGLENIKKHLAIFVNSLKVRHEKTLAGKSVKKFSAHTVFGGPPGTGKTTVGRVVGDFLHALGYLDKGHLVESDRNSFVGGYQGHSAPKTHETVDKALGGVLLIDEAYTLIADEKDTFGKEAFATLMKRMEDDRDKFVAILAGYDQEMDTLLARNPGMKDRINDRIAFTNYSNGELTEIFASMMKSDGNTFDKNIIAQVNLALSVMQANGDESFANARVVRNFYEDTMKLQENRLAIEKEQSGVVGTRSVDVLSQILVQDLAIEERIPNFDVSKVDLNSLKWVSAGENPKEYSYADLTADMKPFPSLTADSIKQVEAAMGITKA